MRSEAPLRLWSLFVGIAGVESQSWQASWQLSLETQRTLQGVIHVAEALEARFGRFKLVVSDASDASVV